MSGNQRNPVAVSLAQAGTGFGPWLELTTCDALLAATDLHGDQLPDLICDHVSGFSVLRGADPSQCR